MNRADAILHAWATTEMLWLRLEPDGALNFSLCAWAAHEYVDEAIAAFLDRAPDATAEVLHRHLCGPRIRHAPWERTTPSLRVCLEIFRATYLALMVLVRAEEAAALQSRPAIQKPLADRGIGTRAMRKRGGLAKRVRLGPPPGKGGAKRKRVGAKAPSASRP